MLRAHITNVRRRVHVISPAKQAVPAAKDLLIAVLGCFAATRPGLIAQCRTWTFWVSVMKVQVFKSIVDPIPTFTHFENLDFLGERNESPGFQTYSKPYTDLHSF